MNFLFLGYKYYVFLNVKLKKKKGFTELFKIIVYFENHVAVFLLQLYEDKYRGLFFFVYIPYFIRKLYIVKQYFFV